MWTGDIPKESLLVAVSKGNPYLRTGPDGSIYHANEAFCELLGYTEYELKKKGWIELSVKGDDLEADKIAVEDVISGNRQVYKVIKPYVSKSGLPIPGELLVIRYPVVGEVEYFHCWFTPLANGSRAALNLVSDYIQQHTNATKQQAEAIASMQLCVEKQTKQTVGRRLWDSFGEWALENPKSAITIIIILLSLNPLPIVMTYITRSGLFPAQPVQLEVKKPDGETVQIKSYDEFVKVNTDIEKLNLL